MLTIWQNASMKIWKQSSILCIDLFHFGIPFTFFGVDEQGLRSEGFREPLQEQFDHYWTHLKLTNILFIIFISEI